MRCDDRKISELSLLLAQEVLQDVAHDGAAGQPQRQAETDALREGEELHLLAELAVVALAGFLKELEILVQHGLLGEGDAVDTGKLLALLVTAPVCSGDGGELYGLDDLGIHEVRSAAEVGESAVGIVGDGSVLEFADEFALVRILLVLEMLHGCRLGDIDTGEGLLGPGEVEHFLLNLGQVGISDLMTGKVHVIIEAVLDGGADAELDAGIEGL